MKQKLALSCALIHRPKVLFLDEPTTGVDAVSRQEFWDMLKQMKNHGISVFVSTPYMDEAILCDRIALIQKGNILDIASPDEVVRNFTKILIRVKAQNRYKLLQDLRTFPSADSVYPYGEYTHVTFKTDIKLNDLEAFLAQKGHEKLKVEKTQAGIEDRFIELMDNN
jgi:ABC-type multidrug transport system ATPase subunit